MPRFAFELATAEDDAELKALIASAPMPGAVEVTLRREPSFFHAIDVQGPFGQVIVIRDRLTGRIVGTGSRSVGLARMDGQAVPVGYLGGLRLVPEVRSATLLARGYGFLRELHGDGRAPFYVTTILASNAEARRLLTSGRAGLPRYTDHGAFVTYAVRLRRRRGLPARGVAVGQATQSVVPELLACLERSGRRKPFSPVRTAAELLDGAAHLRDLALGDFFLARRDGRVVGVAAAWDQSRFKQTVVTGYTGWLRWLRPAGNLLALCGLAPALPPPGTALRQFLVSAIAIDDDDPAVFAALLRALCRRGMDRGFGHCLIGLHERDPLVAALRPYRPVVYPARLYVVDWDDGPPPALTADARVPHVELATL